MAVELCETKNEFRNTKNMLGGTTEQVSICKTLGDIDTRIGFG